MLHQQTLDKLYDMKLNGLAEAYQEQQRDPQAGTLSFEDRFTQLVERQWLWKEDRALRSRLRYARLRQTACVEDLDFRSTRGLHRSVIDQLSSCEWIRYHQNCLITGPTGVGKSYLACALAHKACREHHRVLYYYVPKLFREVTVAQGYGTLARMLDKIARVDLLVVEPLGREHIGRPGIVDEERSSFDHIFCRCHGGSPLKPPRSRRSPPRPCHRRCTS